MLESIAWKQSKFPNHFAVYSSLWLIQFAVRFSEMNGIRESIAFSSPVFVKLPQLQIADTY